MGPRRRWLLAVLAVLGIAVVVAVSMWSEIPKESSFSSPHISLFDVEEILVLYNSTSSQSFFPKRQYPLYSFFPENDDYDTYFDQIDDAYCEFAPDDFDVPPFNSSSAPASTMAHQLADTKLAEVRKMMGATTTNNPIRGPLIVGGIGDSGTRGVYALMRSLGVYMLYNGEVIQISKDSKPFLSAHRVTASDGTTHSWQAFDLYMQAIRDSGTLGYNLTSSSSADRVHLGRQWVAEMMVSTLDFYLRHRLKYNLEGGPGKHRFGFKHPRTALVLPYLLAALGGEFAFIHVLRDGRELARGNNVHVFQDICHAYYGSAGKCREHRIVDMWASMNRDIFLFAKQHLQPHQYFAVRIEDLVAGRRPCYDLFARFVRAGAAVEDATAKRMEQTMREEMMPHASSYFGNKFSLADRRELVLLENQSPSVRRALRFWGYNLRSLQRTALVPCHKLPWTKVFRKAKQLKKV